jgi:release factor glutamine methyltransferase
MVPISVSSAAAVDGRAVARAEPGRLPPSRVLLRPLHQLLLWVRFRVFERRYGRLVIERLDSVPLVVLPAVFNPVLLRTGAILARSVHGVYEPWEGRGKRALDMGTGSGSGAVFAALRGFDVVAVDINPEAVRCARINLMMNGLEPHVDVRQGDLFGPLGQERFDLVLFNPPFFRGRPKDALDQAWRDDDVIERFAAELPRHLAQGGRALIVLSTDGEERAMLDALAGAGVSTEAVVREDLGNEIVSVYSAYRG